MMKTTEETLKAVGVEDVPVIYAYNKADLIEGEIYLSKRKIQLSFPRVKKKVWNF